MPIWTNTRGPNLVGATLRGYLFWCPACSELHPYSIAGQPPLWTFDGNMERPSFAPSWRRVGGNECHLYVSDGKIVYCGDSKHALAGKTVEMIDLDENGRPLTMAEDEKTKPKPAPATSQKTLPKKSSAGHHDDAGDVGDTGEHGALGSNAEDTRDRE